MIPAVIHHVWPGDDAFRGELHRFRATWFKHHPDWTFRFWRCDVPEASADVRALLADPRYSVIVKSDVLRYELLRIHGGIYVDTDMECLRPFDDLRNARCFIARESEEFLCPSVIGCEPDHPFITRCAREALVRAREAGPERANRAPNTITGPHLVTALAHASTDLTVHPRHYFYPVGWWETARLADETPDAYAKHWWAGTGERGWTKSVPHPEGPIRYDLGGVYPRAGYRTVNLAPGADIHCDITKLDLLHPRDGEVDEFLLEHTLEHIPVTAYVQFLRDLKRKLRVGGAVVVVQTDADCVIRDYVQQRLSFRSMRSTLFTPEERLRDTPLNLHVNMWSAVELARDFEAIGFETSAFDAGTWTFDLPDGLAPAEVSRDHGKPIRNLGIRAVRRD